MSTDIQDSEIFKMHAFVSIVNRMVDEILGSNFDISYIQLQILFMLNKQPNANQKDISNCLGITEPAISRQIEVLVQKQYLSRFTDPDNRRKNLMTLTQTGIEIFQKANNFLLTKAEDIFEVLAPLERKQLSNTLDRLLLKLNLNLNS